MKQLPTPITIIQKYLTLYCELCWEENHSPGERTFFTNGWLAQQGICRRCHMQRVTVLDPRVPKNLHFALQLQGVDMEPVNDTRVIQEVSATFLLAEFHPENAAIGICMKKKVRLGEHQDSQTCKAALQNKPRFLQICKSGKFFFVTACGLNRCWKHQSNSRQLQRDSFFKAGLSVLCFVKTSLVSMYQWVLFWGHH